jgi:mannitol-specific phosphotransferase system IIBC component
MSDGLVVKSASDVKLIVFACEAGMGSSLMGAKQLQKMVKKAKLDIEVVHSPVNQVPSHADVIVTHKSLAGSARTQFPDAAIVSFMLFFGDPAVTKLVETLKAGDDVVSVL